MAEYSDIETLIDCSDHCFLSPTSMMRAIDGYCSRHNLQIPMTIGEYARVIYRSLAMCYKNTAEEIEQMTGNIYSAIHIVGGGSNAEYLNRLTADFTGKVVCAGPSEATAYGNAAIQLLADGTFCDLSEIRRAIRKSCTFRIYT